jgi:hypothetical protein
MKFILNNKGIALVTSLMITLLSLTIVMSLLLMITQSIQTSGQLKKYKTALDASYGGVEIVSKDILPIILQNYESGEFFKSSIQSDFDAITLVVESSQDCLLKKLTSSSKDWPSGCSNAPSPKSSPDISFKLTAASGTNYKIYSKIVETIQGNSDTSGLQLEGSGVAESSSLLKPKHFPYVYRMEIQGERENNPTEQANIEVLYAY